jgi:hypothetical protein
MWVTLSHRIQKSKTWNGVHFLAYTTGERPGETRRFCFRRRAEGILIGFSEEEWSELRGLFRRALAAPNLQSLLAELSLAYGEL